MMITKPADRKTSRHCRLTRQNLMAPAAGGLQVVVFNIDGRDIPIVHRTIKVHERASSQLHMDVLTKVMTLAPMPHWSEAVARQKCAQVLLWRAMQSVTAAGASEPLTFAI